MGKIIETQISRWDGGITNDPRDPRASVATVITNFDILTDPHRLIPYYGSEDGDSSSSNNKIHNFCIAKLSATATAIYGLGRSTSGTDRSKVFYRDISSDLADATWSSHDSAKSESSADSSAATESELFVYYENQNRIYMADIYNDKIMAYDPSGATNWDETTALTMTHVTNGIVHSKDDICYFAYYNSADGTSGIYKKDGASAWAAISTTFPKNFRPTVIREYGNYIAIGGEIYSPTAVGFNGSIVYIWDRDSTLETLSESIYWGDDRLMVMDEINGTLIGISFTTGTARFKPRITFRYYSVGEAIEFFTLTPTKATGTPDMTFRSQKINNKLCFLLEAQIDGEGRDGIWSVSGRPGDFKIVHERTPNNDTAITNSTSSLVGFYFVGDYCFISRNDNGTYAMTKTNDAETYVASSIHEKLFRSGGSSLKKDLIGATVETEPMSANGQIILKYKIDHNTSWTTIFTDTTDNSLSHSAINIESSGAALPKDYKEISFRIESTGGAVITGFNFMEEITGKRVYMALFEAIIRWGKSLIK
ncbi:MAG: hypothetical protein AABY07_01985 [Nanoarchaeota archaeon]